MQIQINCFEGNQGKSDHLNMTYAEIDQTVNVG